MNNFSFIFPANEKDSLLKLFMTLLLLKVKAPFNEITFLKSDCTKARMPRFVKHQCPLACAELQEK